MAAKALLMGEGVSCNTQKKIVTDFDETFVQKGLADFGGISFEELVFQLDKNEPSLEFATKYYAQAKAFTEQVKAIRTAQIARLENEEAVN